MLRIFFLLLFICVPCLRGADSSALRVGLSESKVEKLIGESESTEYLKVPAFRKRCLYYLRGVTDSNGGSGRLELFYDRDGRAAKFEFRFWNGSNGGSDPRTGKAWRMPPSFVNYCLKLFTETQWKQVSENRLQAIDRSMFATVTVDGVTVTGR